MISKQTFSKCFGGGRSIGSSIIQYVRQSFAKQEFDFPSGDLKPEPKMSPLKPKVRPFKSIVSAQAHICRQYCLYRFATSGLRLLRSTYFHGLHALELRFLIIPGGA